MLSTFAAVCFGMVLAAASFVKVDVSATRDLIRDNLHSQAESIAHNLSAALLFDDPLTVRQDLNRLQDQPNILRAAVYRVSDASDSREDKQRIFSTYRRDKEQTTFPDIITPFENKWADDTAWAIRPVMDGDQVIGALFLERDLTDLGNRFRRYAGMAFGVAAIGVIVTMMGAIWFQGFLTRPILELSHAAQRVIRKKDYSTRAKKYSEDELGDLTETFNDMLSTIDEANSVLQESHEEMEKRVEIRTQELTTANGQLVNESKGRERAEHELLDAHRRLQLQEKLAAVGQVSANVAHELRNPLGAIRQSLYYLDRKLPANEKIRTHFDLIKNELVHSEEIITGLLEMTRDKKLTITSFDLLNLVKEVADYCRLDQNISLVTKFDENPFVVHADQTLLRQVFINLLTNAQQAMPGGGQITVSGKKLKDGSTIVTLSDTGHGIKKNELPKVFDVLHTNKTDGVGLGLNLCRDILQRHEGSVCVESSNDKGTTILLTLPNRKRDRHQVITNFEKNDFAFDDVRKE